MELPSISHLQPDLRGHCWASEHLWQRKRPLEISFYAGGEEHMRSFYLSTVINLTPKKTTKQPIRDNGEGQLLSALSVLSFTQGGGYKPYAPLPKLRL